jgi:antitoxin VapB
MSINIKNAETHRLAAELAEKLGTTLTEAVTVALRDRLAQEQRDALIAARKMTLRRTSQRLATMIGPEGLADHDALLYDERGLPR